MKVEIVLSTGEKILVPEWVDIYGCEGRYQINTKQQVRSTFNGYKAISPSLTGDGYKRFSAYVAGRKKNVKVARATAIAFIPNPLNLATVNHINGHKADDRIENLEWMTNGDNVRHAYRNGVFSAPECESSKKPCAMIDESGNIIERFSSVMEASKKTGVNKSNIGHCCRGLHKTTGKRQKKKLRFKFI